MKRPPRLVVKIGGSLHADPARLRVVLEILRTSATPLVLVPGGADFANAVRSSQARYGFSEACAHDMALLGMAQYGRLLAELGRLAGAGGVAELSQGWPARTTVWLPDPDRDALEVERSWRVGADALALWLAEAIGAERVVLVKRGAAEARPEPLGAAGVGTSDGAGPRAADQADAGTSREEGVATAGEARAATSGELLWWSAGGILDEIYAEWAAARPAIATWVVSEADPHALRRALAAST